MELFIPNTRKRYSINEWGIVFSHYRYMNNGKKKYRKVVVRKGMNGKRESSSPCFVESRNGKTYKKHFVNTLMVKLFKIKYPDKHHQYDIVPKDKDFFNNSVVNIGFKIRMGIGNYPFYPQPFYNEEGIITHKICACCGVKKEIEDFAFNSKKESSHNKTYRNITESCRGIRQWNEIKKDPERLKLVIELKSKWESSKRGRAYRKQYNRDAYKYNKENLTPHYIASKLSFYKTGLTEKDLTPELIELVKKDMSITNKIKQIKNGKK